MTKKFRTIYAQNPSYRVSLKELEDMCEQVVYVCTSPVFDEFISPDFRSRFEHKIEESMSDFDPVRDAIAFHGDSLILVMMTTYILSQHSAFIVLRFSNKANVYIERLISENWFDREPADV